MIERPAADGMYGPIPQFMRNCDKSSANQRGRRHLAKASRRSGQAYSIPASMSGPVGQTRIVTNSSRGRRSTRQMQPQRNPIMPHLHQYGPVHTQQRDRGAADGRQSDHSGAVRAPREMIIPGLS